MEIENYKLQEYKDTLSHFIDINAENKAEWNKMQKNLNKIFTYIVKSEIEKGELKQQIKKIMEQAFKDGYKQGQEDTEVFGATYFIQKNEQLEKENAELKTQIEEMNKDITSLFQNSYSLVDFNVGTKKLLHKWELKK